MFQQAASRGFANSRNLSQLRRAISYLAALAMEGNGEAMRFIADQLHQMQHRRMVIENYGLALLPVDVDDFFALGYGSQGLIDYFEGFQRLGCRVELTETSVDQDQARHVLFLFAEPLIAPGNHFSHAGKIVYSGYGLDD